MSESLEVKRRVVAGLIDRYGVDSGGFLEGVDGAPAAAVSVEFLRELERALDAVLTIFPGIQVSRIRIRTPPGDGTTAAAVSTPLGNGTYECDITVYQAAVAGVFDTVVRELGRALDDSRGMSGVVWAEWYSKAAYEALAGAELVHCSYDEWVAPVFATVGDVRRAHAEAFRHVFRHGREWTSPQDAVFRAMTGAPWLGPAEVARLRSDEAAVRDACRLAVDSDYREWTHRVERVDEAEAYVSQGALVELRSRMPDGRLLSGQVLYCPVTRTVAVVAMPGRHGKALLAAIRGDYALFGDLRRAGYLLQFWDMIGELDGGAARCGVHQVAEWQVGPERGEARPSKAAVQVDVDPVMGEGISPGRIPPPRTGATLPDDIPLLSEYVGEDEPLMPCPPRMFPDPVCFMTPEEREIHRVFVGPDGRLYRAHHGQPFDTTGYATMTSTGLAMFVMDRSGNLYAGELREGVMQHSSFLAGGNVVGAGEMRVQNGVLVAMTDKSGHYLPRPAGNDRVLRHLCELGLVPSDGFRQFDYAGEPR